MDKLIVKGLDSLNGEYQFDLVEMLTIDSGEALTNRELRRIKQMSDVRAGELENALKAGDNDVLIALAAIILTRAGKRVDEDKLWDAPMGSGVDFDIADRPEGEEGEESLPPPQDTQPNAPTGPPKPNGGPSSRTSAEDPQENDPSRTGLLSSGTPTPDRDFGLEISPI